MTLHGGIREALLLAAVLFCVGYSWLSITEIAPNERARIYLSVSLVERGEVKIDKEVERYGRNWDLSKKDGHWYCNKPPGASFLGAISYWVGKRVTGNDGTWSLNGLFQWMRYTVMLPLALLGFIAIRRWLALLGMSEPVIDTASLAWMMGSAAFHYSHAFFSHHICAVLLVVSMWLLERVRQSRSQGGTDRGAVSAWRNAGLMLLVGASLGLSGLTEYQAGVSCVLVAIWILGVREFRRWHLIVPFAVAAGVFLAGLLYYNQVAFGGPLEFSYLHHISGGHTVPISKPKLEYFSGLMVSLHRGIIPTSPWVLLAVPGIAYLFMKEGQRSTALLLGAIVFYRILFLSSYKWWSGDWGFGPRHMVPVLGVLTVLAAATMERWRRNPIGTGLAKGLVIAGMLYNQIQTAFLAELPLGARNPIMDVVVPLARHGVTAPNLRGILTGDKGLITLVPLAIVAGGLVVVVLVRGLSIRWKWWKKVLCIVLALVPSIVLGSVIHAVGPTWKKKKQESFRKLMDWKLDVDMKWHRRDNDKE